MESCSRIFRTGFDLQNLFIVITFTHPLRTPSGAYLFEYKASLPLKSPPALINAVKEVGSYMSGKVPNASLVNCLQQLWGTFWGHFVGLPRSYLISSHFSLSLWFSSIIGFQLFHRNLSLELPLLLFCHGYPSWL